MGEQPLAVEHVSEKIQSHVSLDFFLEVSSVPMTWFQLLSSVLVSLGPLAVVFATLIVPKSSLLIISLAGAVGWLIAATLASVLWRLLTPASFYPIIAVVLCWIFITGSRCFLCWLWFKLRVFLLADSTFVSKPSSTSNDTLEVVADDDDQKPRAPLPPPRSYALEEHALSLEDEEGSITTSSAGLSVGCGFALAQTLITQAPLWEASAGPGTLMSLSCSGLTSLALSSLIASILALLQIIVTVLSFDGFKRKSVSRVCLASSIYLIASLATVVNSATGESLCIAPLLVDFSLLLTSAALVHYTSVRAPPPILPRKFSSWRTDFFPNDVSPSSSDDYRS